MAPYKATFLNDLTRDAEGNLYLSDSQSNFVARIEPAHEHRVTILARGPQLAGANGLSVQPKTGRLAVVTWGTGRVLEVTKQGEVKPWLDRRFEKLDGADFDADGNLYFSAYGEGKVYRVGRGREGLRLPRRTRHARGHQHRPGEGAVAHPFLRRGLGPRDPLGEVTSDRHASRPHGPWAAATPRNTHEQTPPHARDNLDRVVASTLG